MQKDKMEIRQNIKRQFTNMIKHKKTEHKYKLQILQQTNVTKYKCDKIKMQQNTNATKLKKAK